MDPSLRGQPVPVPTKQKQPGIITKRTLFLSLGIGVAIIAGIILLFASGDKSATLQPRLAARQATTLLIIADGQKNISDGDLRKLNSDLSIVLNGDNATLQGALVNAGAKKASKEITADEADSATFEELKSAKLNGLYDTTYRRVLETKLETLRALIKEVHGASRNTPLRLSLSAEYAHLGSYLENLQNLR